MPNINIAVKNKIARQTNETEYICGNSDFLIDFDFDSEWDAYEEKIARFVYNGAFQEVFFTGNRCEVPIISNTNTILCGVYAGELKTTTPALIPAKKSILCGTPAPAPSTPDVFAQIVTLLNMNDTVQKNAEAAALSEKNAKASEDAAKQYGKSASDSAAGAKACESRVADSVASVEATVTTVEQLQRLTFRGEYSDSTSETVPGSLFMNSQLLRSVTFAEATEIGLGAFERCSRLEVVKFPKAEIIGENAFRFCATDNDVSLGVYYEQVFPLVKQIKSSAFYSCGNFTNNRVVFPSLESLGSAAFGYCETLKEFYAPKLTSIADIAFYGCYALVAVVLANTDTVCSIGENVFNYTPIANGTGYIYVPAAMVGIYKEDERWSVFANQIRALEDYTVDGTITGLLDNSKI